MQNVVKVTSELDKTRERVRNIERDGDYRKSAFIHLLVMRDLMAIAKEEEKRLIIQTQRLCLMFSTFTGVVFFSLEL